MVAWRRAYSRPVERALGRGVWLVARVLKGAPGCPEHLEERPLCRDRQGDGIAPWQLMASQGVQGRDR